MLLGITTQTGKKKSLYSNMIIILKGDWSPWHDRRTKKKSESPTEIKPMPYTRTHGGCSYHWGLRAFGEQDHLTHLWPCSKQVLIAQWIEHPTSVWEVMGSIPAKDSDFLFAPRLCMLTNSTFTLRLVTNFLLSSLKFTIFIHLSVQY